jgi:hypothetical protein
MLMKPVALAAILISLASAPAFAEAVTYTGTLGAQAIVLELTEPSDGTLTGRYSYLSRGADIPLHVLSTSEDGAVLAEELPCTPALCMRADGNHVLQPPLGGQFQLQYAADGTKLTGTWRASASASAELPVDLTRFGQRAFELREGFLYRSLLWMNYGGAPIAPDTSPYDYAKMQVALTEGPMQAMGGATYREVIDPRTKFAFPRIVSLPGGGDVAPINAILDQERWATNFAGFECLSTDYLSGVWMDTPFGSGGNSLGGIDHQHIAVDYLSDTVMTIRQSGSMSCGGGASYDYVEYLTYDVRAGSALDLSQIFKDWDATSNDPTQPLIDWLFVAYRKTSDYDADFAAWYEDDEYVAEKLDVRFVQNDVAVFLISDPDQTASMRAIVTVPLADIRDLLTSKAANYFPALKS